MKKLTKKNAPVDEIPEQLKEEKLMDRKAFLKKSGYIALTAASMLILNKPEKALSTSPADMPIWTELKKIKK